MTKKTPKNAAVAISPISFPMSFAGSLRRPRRYMAGIALTERMPKPPAAVAALGGIM
jgi:hypothetical protein